MIKISNLKRLLLVGVMVIGWSPLVLNGQETPNRLSADELRGAEELGARFVRRLEETSEIGPLIAELFVPDFTERYLKEMEAQQNDEGPTVDRVLIAPGLEARPALFGGGGAVEWGKLGNGIFDIMHYLSGNMMNWTAKKHAGGPLKSNGEDETEREIDVEEITKEVMRLLPKEVRAMFDSDPVLQNFLVMKGRRSFETPADLRRANVTLAKALGILKKTKMWPTSRLTSDAKLIEAEVIARDASVYAPRLAVAERESYGYPKGTRLITVYPSLTLELTVVKVGAEYKIVRAYASFPAD